MATIRALREEFWNEVKVTGEDSAPNSELDKALRIQDYLELGELMCRDALQRDESCGVHFREEFRTDEGEALRNDQQFAYVSAWEYQDQSDAVLHKESFSLNMPRPSRGVTNSHEIAT